MFLDCNNYFDIPFIWNIFKIWSFCTLSVK
jgi:hypothetical protein